MVDSSDSSLIGKTIEVFSPITCAASMRTVNVTHQKTFDVPGVKESALQEIKDKVFTHSTAASIMNMYEKVCFDREFVEPFEYDSMLVVKNETTEKRIHLYFGTG